MTENMSEKVSTLKPDTLQEHEMPADSENTSTVPQSTREPVDKLPLDIPDVRSRIQTEFDSNRGYQIMADRIITVSQKHLANQQHDKVELRKKFAKLFSVLLVMEYVFLVLFILLDAIQFIPVDIPESVLQLFTGSVFLQTLATIGVMIAFAFVSKEETRIVGLINQIIQNYQKLQIDVPPKKPKE